MVQWLSQPNQATGHTVIAKDSDTCFLLLVEAIAFSEISFPFFYPGSWLYSFTYAPKQITEHHRIQKQPMTVEYVHTPKTRENEDHLVNRMVAGKKGQVKEQLS